MSKLLRMVLLACLEVSLALLIHTPAAPAQTLGNGNPEPGVKFGGIYRRTLGNNPATLDPIHVSDIYSRTVANQIFDGLVQFDAHLNPVPAIAEFWEVSRDGLTWTFSLRRGVRFHHGREVTAQDFVYSIARQLNPKKPSPLADFLRLIRGSEEFMQRKAASIQGLTAVDRYTLRIVLQEPYAPSLSVLATVNAAVVPQEEVERLGDRFAHAPVGAGPFKFVSWEPNIAVVLQAHERYYEGRAFLDGIVFKISTKVEEDFAEFLKGGMEQAVIPSDRVEEVRTDPKYRRYQLLRKPTLGFVYIGFSTRQKPFDDRRVRQAFNYAVNKEAIVREITRVGSSVANGALPPGMSGHDPDLHGYYYNPAKAQQLLAEAGYPNGVGFPVVHLWSVTRAESVTAELTAYQRYLADVGITSEIHVAPDWASYRDRILQGQLPMFRLARYADIPDPDNFLAPLLHSAGSSNFTGYRNPQVDQLLEEARAELDYTTRVALYREVERLSTEDAPWITQHYQVFEQLFQPHVQGVEISLLGDRFVPMKKIWLKKNGATSVTGATPSVQPNR